LYCQENRLVSLRGLKGVSNITTVYCNNNANNHLSKEFKLRKENPTMYELTQM